MGDSLASVVLAEATDRKTISDRLGRYRRGRQQADSFYNEVNSHDGRRAEKLNGCANLLLFHDHGEHGNRLAAGYYCQQWKLCRICAMRRAAKTLGVLLPKVLQRMQERKTMRAFIVTLTTKDGPDCTERFNHLQDSLRRLTGRARQARKDGSGFVEMNKAAGMYSSTEATRGANSGEWHWHAHMVWIGEERPSWLNLKAEWEDVTGDSFIVHVAELKASQRRRRHPDLPIDEMGLAKELCEVCKYALKPQELQAADAWTVQASTVHRHFTRSYGSLRFTAQETEQIETENEEPALPGEPVTRLFRWWRAGSCYTELVAGGGEHIDRPLRIFGAHQVNKACTLRYRSRGLGGDSPLLDKRGKIGGTFAGAGPPAHRESVAARLSRPPSDREDCFA